MLNVWTTCERLSTAKPMVRPIHGAAGSTSKNTRPMLYASRESAPTRHPSTAMLYPILPANTLSPRRTGRRSMILGSMGSTPRASAGSESVTRLTQSSWMGCSGNGSRSRKPTKTERISPMLQLSRKWTVFLMFS